MVWCTVLRFEALYALYAPEVCQGEVFSTAYALRKTTQDAQYFVPQSWVGKIIINMVDNDHGIRDTLVGPKAFHPSFDDD